MKWFEKCLLELTHHNLFETTEHRSRFLDLTSCYYTAPFFTKGLCKCMYLSSGDEDHFDVMLDTMNGMIINGVKDLRMMTEEGRILSRQLQGTDGEIYKLATCFLSREPYELPDMDIMDPDIAYLIRRALLAGRCIDDLPDPAEG